jgi:hypothetical protein
MDLGAENKNAKSSCQTNENFGFYRRNKTLLNENQNPQILRNNIKITRGNENKTNVSIEIKEDSHITTGHHTPSFDYGNKS